MAEVVGLLLSPFLQVFFEKIASGEFVDFFRSRKLDSRLLKRLEIVLLSANAVLEYAEEMQFTEHMVKKWLDELKDAVYDAEDILDEIHTEVLRCKLDAEFQTIATKSLTSLPDKMHVLLPSLGRLSLGNCPEVESFPEGGLPSKLSSIDIIDCDKLIANRRGWGFQNLPSIRYINVQGNCKDVESFPEAGLLPTNLVSLEIGKFPNMKSLDYKALRHLTSLDDLSIYFCPKLKFMKEEGLPASISTLWISQCALLEKQLESRKGKARSKIDHIPDIYIN
ncbi:hypothetical protein CIPAW_13G160300 [Carya illinoinensis]|uniref:Disease resistance N-terminal domain-containing protein n=1 Tax=Carya illinoinensis TaxID=32201 RepID=A0A8T1NLG6_CARIL|nr:hypothetical protein CIPAW_13G160300 [Carya illinoinensis]KAG6632448.1 hypothetical protein CIPAW_13G160300 [Carya illinoinensis]KAG6632449.1 hypothetical protein CIPAW_13G160300 [Carya illinoinensis]